MIAREKQVWVVSGAGMNLCWVMTVVDERQLTAANDKV